MSRKRKLIRSSCTNKIRYENEAAALIALRVLDENKNYTGQPYRCQFCGSWHAGRPSKKRKEALRMQRMANG